MALSITLSGSVSMLNGIMLNVLAQIYLIKGSGFCFSDDDHDEVSECDGQKPSFKTFQNLFSLTITMNTNKLQRWYHSCVICWLEPVGNTSERLYDTQHNYKKRRSA